MSFGGSPYQRDVRVKIRRAQLPPAEEPPSAGTTLLRGHIGHRIRHVVAVPERGLIATVTPGAPGLRIFALNGDGQPLNVCAEGKGVKGRALAALGGDVLAFGDQDGRISTWCASSGECLDGVMLSPGETGTAIAPVGAGIFVVGNRSGALIFVSHCDGRKLRILGRGSVSHENAVTDIAVHGNLLVTASSDKTAAVWRAATRERVAVLRGHNDEVMCGAISARFIATGSADRTIRLYDAGEGHALFCVIEGLHEGWISRVEFVAADMLMSTSFDKTVAFTSLSSSRPLARMAVDFPIMSATITPDARLACVGANHGAVILSPPALALGAVIAHAATEFSHVVPPFCRVTRDGGVLFQVHSKSDRKKRQRTGFEKEGAERAVAGKGKVEENFASVGDLHGCKNEVADASAPVLFPSTKNRAYELAIGQAEKGNEALELLEKQVGVAVEAAASAKKKAAVADKKWAALEKQATVAKDLEARATKELEAVSVEKDK